MKIVQTANYGETSLRAAQIIFSQVVLKPDCVLGLATGATPVGIYENLVRWHREGALDFSRVTGVNLDEYCGLEPTDSQSYRHFMEEKLYAKINIAPENTHVPKGTADPLEECARYDRVIEACGGIDLQLLGLGHNGHIGFNEPAEAFLTGTHCVDLSEETIQANRRFFEREDQVPRRAVTVGLRAIMQAKKVLLVVSGSAKAGILQQALYGPVTPWVPASILQLHPDVTVVADQS